MTRSTFAVLAVLLVTVTAEAQRGAPKPGATQMNANEAFDRLADTFHEELAQFDPVSTTANGDDRYNDRYVVTFDPAVMMKRLAVQRKYLVLAEGVDPAKLDVQRRLSRSVLIRSLRQSIAMESFPSHQQPVNQFYNFASSFAQLGSGTGIHPFKTVKDYDDFVKRMDGFVRAVDIAIVNMKRGAASGVVQPRLLMERTLPQLAAHVVDEPEKSIFWGPIRNIPASFTTEETARLTQVYRKKISDEVIPAYARLHDFIRDEYMPKARTTAGMSALPNGGEWYRQLVRQTTTTDLTPEQIHEMGLAEVARIHAEMEKVKKQVGFEGDLQAFFRHLSTSPEFKFESREQMLAEYRAAKKRIDDSTDRLFDIKPKADYEIRPVEAFRERSAASGSYQAASPDGTRPGVFYLNTYEPQSRSRYGVETLLVHEGSPGHHFQISVQRELETLPRFRRFSSFGAYLEGWALYTETIGKELGIFEDPYQYYGSLSSELWRAIRLVLDTGIHAKGWTREQAIEWAQKNSSNSLTSITSEVERFMAIPSQALSYKIGQMKITELRRRAERELGPAFDIKAFHRAVLENGALPLDLLDERINEWIAERKPKTP